jgi:predicted ABC-type ATPase
MVAKRMRVFAGPNGSGKTTVVKRLQAEMPFGLYLG